MKRYPCPKCGKTLVTNGLTPAGKQRYRCEHGRVHCYSTTNPTGKGPRKQDGSAKKPPKFNRSLKGATRFIVTAAQNATPVHRGFLKALSRKCIEENAELIVVPIRYKNPTSRWTQSQANEEVWAKELTPFLINTRKKLNKHLVLLADVKTQPTADAPLARFEAITHGESAILAHTKLQLKTIATPQNRLPKILTTTGAITEPNYTDTKNGKIGEFHHTLGACMVEIRDNEFHLRQINADKNDGSFIDLNMAYAAEEAYPVMRADALVMGDTHVDFVDPAVVRATFGPGGIVETLKPKILVWHDLLDGYSVNPHHNGNPFIADAKVQNNRADARAEVERALEFVAQHTPMDTESIVVPSNHDDFLSRWIIGSDWRNLPGNAEFYLETALAMVRGTKLTGIGTEYPSPFPYWGRQAFGLNGRVQFLDRDQSYMLSGIELGMHGDKGTNGARGSLRNLRRIGVKSIIGHTHSPGIDEGAMQVGTSTGLRLEYTSGPSGWLNTHAVVYANGKRSLINIINGKWRLQ